MNVVDSSAWLEYFANGPNAGKFAAAIEDTARLVVPTICVLEVFRNILRQQGKTPALDAAALMQEGRLQELDVPLALAAAQIGVETKLPLADSVILATARMHGALLWTQDADFKGIEGVRYFSKSF